MKHADFYGSIGVKGLRRNKTAVLRQAETGYNGKGENNFKKVRCG